MAAENFDPFAQELRGPELTADLLGKLFILQWSKRHGKSRLPEKGALNRLFLDSYENAPTQVRQLLHADYRLQDPEIVEITDFLVAGQRVGLVERPNPSHVPCDTRLTPYWAGWFLDSYQDDFREELGWLDGVISKLKPS
ncbi:hypothetical protein MTBLM1_40097 [Rhodospirillaceae bacterium LM-1]|nr:hypothetical protein MTBLM1_40097 [Rhodospirillaceae bacterium LM-1]